MGKRSPLACTGYYTYIPCIHITLLPSGCDAVNPLYVLSLPIGKKGHAPVHKLRPLEILRLRSLLLTSTLYLRAKSFPATSSAIRCLRSRIFQGVCIVKKPPLTLYLQPRTSGPSAFHQPSYSKDTNQDGPRRKREKCSFCTCFIFFSFWRFYRLVLQVG